MIHYIYRLTDGDIVMYVGRTTDPLRRHADHERNHGRKFILVIAHRINNIEDAKRLETEEIRKYEPALNFSETSSQGRLGMPHTEETKAKIGEANRGRERSPEWREKIASSLRGRKASEETKAKLRAASPHRKPTPEEIEKLRQSRLGAVASEETKAKLRAAWERRKARNEPNGFAGRKHSEESLEKMRIAHAKRKVV
jgi:hypothetical protein